MSIEGTPIAIDPSTLATSHEGLARRFLRNPLGVVSLAVLVVVTLVGLLAPWIMPQDPNLSSLAMTNAPIGGQYLLGGDSSGRDILSRLIAAINVSMESALIVAGVAAVIGVPAGLIAGYFGRGFEAVSTWIFNLLQAFPVIVILLAIYSVIGSSSELLTAALGVLLSVSFFRLVRSLVIGVKNELYVDAARVSGLSNWRILGRHVLYVVRAPVIITASYIAGLGITLQSSLAFLGITNATVPTWGGMILEAFSNLYTSPIEVLWPAMALGITVGAFVLFGTAVRDTLEGPRVSSRRLKAPRRRTEGAALEDGGALLSVSGLSIGYPQGSKIRLVVDDVSLEVQPGEILGLVGESGSGKTQTAFAILGLLPESARVTAGTIRVNGANILNLPPARVGALRGKVIAYVPQEPMSNLDPSFTVGSQLVYGVRAVTRVSRAEAKKVILGLLARVGIADPERTFRAYPHEISGGMAQRVLIAGAVACNPNLLIADEPTTALDVTVQAEILDLLRDLQKESGMGVVLVTHNFGVVADLCDRVAVMKEGRIIESGPTREIFAMPQNDYTKKLLASILDDRSPLRRGNPGSTLAEKATAR
ncbi:MAG: transporter [Rhodoglobus sp.]|nr:transporter [Rhodoglobus sp.]